MDLPRIELIVLTQKLRLSAHPSYHLRRCNKVGERSLKI
jgi:hypothetical protein